MSVPYLLFHDFFFAFYEPVGLELHLNGLLIARCYRQTIFVHL